MNQDWSGQVVEQRLQPVAQIDNQRCYIFVFNDFYLNLHNIICNWTIQIVFCIVTFMNALYMHKSQYQKIRFEEMSHALIS